MGSLYSLSKELFIAVADHLYSLLGEAIDQVYVSGTPSMDTHEVTVELVPVKGLDVEKRWRGYQKRLPTTALSDPSCDEVQVMLSETSESLKDAFTDARLPCSWCQKRTRHQRIKWHTDSYGDEIVTGRCLECGHIAYWTES